MERNSIVLNDKWVKEEIKKETFMEITQHTKTSGTDEKQSWKRNL